MSYINADDLKEYIIENNCIFTILDSLGCHDIKEYQEEWRAALPDGTNKTAICVKKNNLSSAIRSSEKNEYGDIFTLTMAIKGFGFGKANKYLHNILNLRYSYTNNKQEEKNDPLSVFKKIKRKKHIIDQDIPIYDSSCMKEYTDLPYIGWVREGIMPNICKRFNIGYSYDKKRIIIPWRKWDGDKDDYIGVVGRTTVQNYEMFDIPKYFSIIPFKKSYTLYGLNENYKYIQEAGYVNIFESEKSVLKRCSRLDNTGVAVGSHTLSQEQLKILIGLNVNIVIIYDKDVKEEDVYKECEKFYNIRNVYFVIDRWDLLGEKESPADKENKVFNFMWKHKIKYDEKYHNKYKRLVEEK